MIAQHKEGFTLIELLIVVAIIGILAAIAIPNFLQAQVRAKTARVLSDMRNIGIAYETYRIDENEYPWIMDQGMAAWTKAHIGGGVYVWNSYAEWLDSSFHLTTPVDYLTSYPSDVFQQTPLWPGRYVAYRQENNMKSVFGDHFGWGSAFQWGLWSFGPDSDPGWSGAPVAPFYDLMPYDPTNGTISLGNIWRVGPGTTAGPY